MQEKDVEFEVFCLSEHTSIRGNCLASGDDEEDEKCARWIEKQLDNGNAWAWCTIMVTGKYLGLSSKSYLGCCSYKSKKDFEDDVYYQDMKNEIIEDLRTQEEEIINNFTSVNKV